ncbi:MAG: hypothetical protein NTU44_15985, partial [Bacteroidetes bacterium]|nr:hypothetical protein [Bacteroidota bacterium]
MKKTYITVLALLFLFNCTFLFGQQGQWTWMKGDTTFNSMGHYGIQGVPDPANTPPALYGSGDWADQ